MTSKAQISFTWFAAGTLVPLLLLAYWVVPLTDTAWFSQKPYEWFTITDYYSNGFFLWRLNPLMVLFTLWSGYSAYILLCIAISLCGIFVLSKELNTDRSQLAISTLITLCTLFALFGVNLPSFALLAIYPWLVWIVLTDKPSVRSLLLTGLFSFFTLNHLGVVAVLSLTPLLLATEHKRRTSSILALLFLFALLAPLTAPHLPNPIYPADGKLVPSYGFLYGIDPIVSYGPAKPYIDRQFTQSFAIITCFISGITSAWILFLASTNAAKRLAMGACAASVIVLLETTLVPADIRLISPLQSLSRIIPGLIAFPLIMYATAISVLLTGMLALIPKHFLVASIGLVSIIATTLGSKTHPAISFGTLANPNAHLESSIVNSPSLYLLRNRPQASHRKIQSGTLKNISALNATLRASHNEVGLASLLTPKTRDRWSTKLGKQTGDEWVQISFEQPHVIDGIEMTLQKYTADYPRGLEILVGDVCNTAQPVFKEQQWLGSTRFTDAGLPYYSHESVIEIPLPEVSAQCIVIRQIGKASSLEWSIENIALSIR